LSKKIVLIILCLDLWLFCWGFVWSWRNWTR